MQTRIEYSVELVLKQVKVYVEDDLQRASEAEVYSTIIEQTADVEAAESMFDEIADVYK